MIASRIAEPAAPPVGVDEFKAHMRIEHAEEDALIAGYLDAATGYLDGVEGLLGRALVTQKWAQSFESFGAAGGRGHLLALEPGVALDAVRYFDSDGAARDADEADFEVVLSSLGYRVRPKSGVSTPATARRDDAVTFEYTVGYGAADKVPAPIRHAILLLAGHYYENREAVAAGVAVAELPLGVKRLVAGYRRRRV